MSSLSSSGLRPAARWRWISCSCDTGKWSIDAPAAAGPVDAAADARRCLPPLPLLVVAAVVGVRAVVVTAAAVVVGVEGAVIAATSGVYENT